MDLAYGTDAALRRGASPLPHCSDQGLGSCGLPHVWRRDRRGRVDPQSTAKTLELPCPGRLV